jgi:predicted Zn-dependent peptidase
MVKEVICQKLFTSLLDRRLRRLSKSTAPGRHVSATQEASLCGCESNANVEHQRQNTSSKALLPILLTGSVGVNPVVPTLERTTMSIWTRKGDEQKGLQCLLVELVSLCRHGFTNQEFTIAREKWRNTITHQSKDPTSCTSSSIAKELKYHYLQGLAFLGNDQENQLSLDALEKLTGNDLLLWILSRYDIEQLYTKKDALTTLSDQFFAVSSQIQKDGEHVPDGFESHQTLAKTFDRTMRLAIEQVDAIQNSIVDFNNTDVNGETKSSVEVDNDDPEWSIQVPKHDHHVVKEAHMKSIDAVEWKLSNGLTVCVKKLEREGKEGIQFQGFALRGRSELNEVEDTNFCFLPDLVAESGLGNLNGLEMSDMRSRKNCRVNVQKHFYHRGIGGSCKSNADVELLLQQIYMIMTKVQLDENALNVLVERTRETVKNQDNSSEVTFMRTVQQLLFGDVPLLRSLTNELLDSVNHQKMQELFNLAFVEKPSNYVLCFTGSIPDINHFKFLIEKYIGAISDKKIQNRREKKEKNMNDDDISTAARWSHGPSASPSPICVSLPTNKVERHVQERVADKATSMICLPVPKLPRDTVAIDHSLKIACNILRNRLLSEVRQKQSDIYNVSVSWNHSHMSRHGAILISWSNKPSNTKRIKDAVMYEIQQLKTNGPLQESLDSVLKIEKRRIEGTVGNASYWLFHILDGYKTHRFVSGETNLSSQSEKTNNDNCENYIRSRCPIGAYERLETFTVQGIQEIFQQYFNVEKMLNCVLGPKIKIENENEKESKM